eukprot:g8462.t1
MADVVGASGGDGGDAGLMSRVLSTTAEASEAQTVARINEEAMATFVDGGGVPLDKYRRAASRVPLPLKFDDAAHEINFHGLLALLSFGGSHEPELARLTGSSVEDAAKFGLIGSHLSREKLDATWMKNANVGSISESFKIPVREDAPSTIPGVSVDRPGALVSHAQALCAVLNETGEALLSRGYADMAQFILHSARSDPGVEGLVRSLSGALPAFRDTETVSGEEVLMLKNAQVLAGDLSARMGKTVQGLRFDDCDKLTAVADADVITALIILGILEPTPPPTATAAEPAAAAGEPQGEPAATAPMSDARVAGPAFKPKDTAALRAVAVQACHRLAASLGDEYRPHELSLYLKRLSRRKEHKDAPRFAEAAAEAAQDEADDLRDRLAKADRELQRMERRSAMSRGRGGTVTGGSGGSGGHGMSETGSARSGGVADRDKGIQLEEENRRLREENDKLSTELQAFDLESFEEIEGLYTLALFEMSVTMNDVQRMLVLDYNIISSKLRDEAWKRMSQQLTQQWRSEHPQQREQNFSVTDFNFEECFPFTGWLSDAVTYQAWALHLLACRRMEQRVTTTNGRKQKAVMTTKTNRKVQVASGTTNVKPPALAAPTDVAVVTEPSPVQPTEDKTSINKVILKLAPDEVEAIIEAWGNHITWRE